MPLILPGDGREQLVLGGSSAVVADVHEHETTGAVGVFGQAAREAGLAEQCRLLVAGDAGEWDRSPEQAGDRFAIDFAAGAHFGQNRGRNIQQPQQFIIPRLVWML